MQKLKLKTFILRTFRGTIAMVASKFQLCARPTFLTGRRYSKLHYFREISKYCAKYIAHGVEI